MMKGTIHKKDRHHKLLDTLTTKKQAHKAKIRRNIREKKKYITIVRHTNISFENILSSTEKIRIGAF